MSDQKKKEPFDELLKSVFNVIEIDQIGISCKPKGLTGCKQRSGVSKTKLKKRIRPSLGFWVMLLPVNEERLIVEFLKKDIEHKWDRMPFSLFGAYLDPNKEPYYASFLNLQDHLQIVGDCSNQKKLHVSVSVLKSTSNFSDFQLKEILEANCQKAVESIFDIGDMQLLETGYSDINRKHLIYLI